MKKFLLLTLCVALFACTNEPVPVKVESVELSRNELILTVDEKIQLKAIILPDNAENKSVYWVSEKSEVAIVEDGLVTAIASGTTTVIAISDDGGKKATCTVTVVPKPILVTGVTLNEENIRLFLGHEVTLTARVIPSDATNTDLIWETSNKFVATVADGTVKAVGRGSSVITVKTKDGGFKAECVVNVTEECQTQVKGPMTLDLGRVTATTAELSGFLDVDQLAGYDVSGGGVGFIYAPSGTKLDIDNAEKVSISSVDSENAFSKTLTGLKYDTRYVYTIFLHKNGIVQYGETQYFDTKEVTISVDQVSVTPTKATLKGKVVRLSEDSDVKVGLMYSSSNTFPSGSKSYTITPYSDGSYTQEITGLTAGATYYYRTYLYYGGRYEYGETKEFTTNTINVTLSVSSKTATTVTFAGKMNPVTDKSDVAIGVYVNTSETVNSSNYKQRAVIYDSDIADDGTFSVTVTGLSMATQYFYTPYVYSTKYAYGEIKDFTTENIVVALSVKSSDITATTAKITGTITGLSDVDKSEIDAIGIAYSTSSSSLKTSSSTKETATLSSDGTFSISLEGLYTGAKYYYCSYVNQDGSYTYGAAKEFTIPSPYNTSADLNVASATDLSNSGSANCYIVSQTGLYKFKAVKGNSSESVGNVASAAILWESFGTSTTPEFFELIKGVCYKDGHIAFQTADTFKEGNAVIAAKDAAGNILWSWHIWLTDQPRECVYKNNIRPMMDRNLGATSADNWYDVGIIGLLYQWGRKDPFLASSSFNCSTLAESTILWPIAVESDSNRGTIDYATSNPTTFILSHFENSDWYYYTGNSSVDYTRWSTSNEIKSIYDPCPAGWRVPDGGEYGVWSKSVGSSVRFSADYYTHYGNGINILEFGGDDTYNGCIIYPTSRYRYGNGDDSLCGDGDEGYYWSASPSRGYGSWGLKIDGSYVYPSESIFNLALACSVRCQKEYK